MNKFPEEIDFALLDYHLSLSAEERVLQHDGALALYLELRKQGERLREENGESQRATEVSPEARA